MATNLLFRQTCKTASSSVKAFLIIGEKSKLTSSNTVLWNRLPASATLETPDVVVEGKAASATYWTGKGSERVQYSFLHLKNDRSRHMGNVRSDLITELISKNTPKEDNVQIIFALEEKQQFAAGCAVARAFPQFSQKTDVDMSKSRDVYIDFASEREWDDTKMSELQHTADNIRLCARLVDAPCSVLQVSSYVDEIKQVAAIDDSISLKLIRGEDLRDQGFGGIYGVGKAAEHPPALAVLTYTPKVKKTKSEIALVGKGIVFDTGGLSLKISGNMVGMKTDMGGSAAVLGAFQAAVKQKYDGVLHAVLCLAENVIGSRAQKVDDVYTAYSGKTVEINNTDAEGRLVLADGVHYASKDLKATHIIDIATLTGAQLITTGRKHAAVLSPDEGLEKQIMEAAKESGDWCHPILYCPELLKKEFESPIADMKNSVKDRMNAQSSCAGHFIESHLAKGWEGKWAHIDIAGPSEKDARGTGFGVALFVSLLEIISKENKA